MAWLGFKQATDHSAEVGETEQSQLSLDPGTATPNQPAPAPTPPPPAPEPAKPPVQAVAAKDPIAEKLKQQTAAAAKTVAELRQRAAELAEEVPPAAPEAVKAPQPATDPVTAPKPPEDAAAAQEPSKAEPPPTPPQPQTAPAKSGMPGIQSDKEATAVAIKKAPTVRPGQVLATQGLEIQTRAPRWTIATMMTRRPRNPTVYVTFGRDGRVRNVEFVRSGVEMYNTGSDEVDQPLLNAIYAWTAKGKQLAMIDPTQPDAGLTIMLTIILSN